MKIYELPPLPPLQFFRIHTEVKYSQNMGGKISRFLLPDTSFLLGQETFADVALAWSEKGIQVHVKVEKKFEDACYPKYQEGDAIELFFDTKDLKDVGFPTSFCHHFLILPQKVQEIQAIELSRFRGEDSHPLCDPRLIQVSSEMRSQSFSIDIVFPSEILHGFDPLVYPKLGFSYCIHRPKNSSQYFSASSSLGSLSQHPSFWASCALIK